MRISDWSSDVCSSDLADHDDVVGALALQSLGGLRHQSLVAGRLAGDADDVDVVFDRLAGGFLRGLEQRADVDVEADVGEGGGDHLGAAIVAVLAQLHHQHARAAALLALASLDLALAAAEALVAFVGGAVDAGHRANDRAVAGGDLLPPIRTQIGRGSGWERVCPYG